MIERLLDLILRLKNIFLKIEQKDNVDSARVLELTKAKAESIVEIEALNFHVQGMQERMDTLDKDHQEALAMLDELEEVIKKWES